EAVPATDRSLGARQAGAAAAEGPDARQKRQRQRLALSQAPASAWWPGAFLCLRRLPAPTPTLVSLGDDRRPPRPRPQSSVRSVRRPALPVPGKSGRRVEQQPLVSAGGIRRSDGGVGVPRLGDGQPIA